MLVSQFRHRCREMHAQRVRSRRSTGSGLPSALSSTPAQKQLVSYLNSLINFYRLCALLLNAFWLQARLRCVLHLYSDLRVLHQWHRELSIQRELARQLAADVVSLLYQC